MLASIVSVLILPWNLFSSPEVIHLTVDLLAALIGPVYGILIVDYYLVKRGKISVADLYSTSSTSLYWYRHGVNWQAVGALLPAGAASILVMLWIMGRDGRTLHFSLVEFLLPLSIFVLHADDFRDSVR